MAKKYERSVTETIIALDGAIRSLNPEYRVNILSEENLESTRTQLITLFEDAVRALRESDEKNKEIIHIFRGRMTDDLEKIQLRRRQLTSAQLVAEDEVESLEKQISDTYDWIR